MSYNIDTWKTKSIDSLEIPLAVIHKMPDVEVKLLNDNKVCITGLSEGFEINGDLNGKNIAVNDITTWGEGSGHTWDDLLKALKHSKGNLVATQVWEGGDSITRLIVKDGTITEEKVEL